MTASVISGLMTVGSRFSLVGQAGKIPCKLDVEFITKSPHTNLNYITSEVHDAVSSSFPPVNVSHDRSIADFEDIDLVILCQEILERHDVYACSLTLNGVYTVTSTEFQPFK